MLTRRSFATALRSAGSVRYGSAITMKDGRINVPNDPIIPFIEGAWRWVKGVAWEGRLTTHAPLRSPIFLG